MMNWLGPSSLPRSTSTTLKPCGSSRRNGTEAAQRSTFDPSRLSAPPHHHHHPHHHPRQFTMPVRLRLARHGTRNSPFYHLVAIADHKPRDARPIEKLGEYDPVPRIRKFLAPQVGQHGNAAVTSSGLPSEEDLKRKEKRLEWNTERIRYWLSVGAQPSKPVAKMLDKVSEARARVGDGEREKE